MTFHAVSVLSGFAYLVFCLLAAGARPEVPFPSRIAQSAQKDHGTVLACLFALPVWLGIPFGTLPAFAPMGWSGVAALVCLAVACAYDAGWRVRHASRLLVPLRLALALAVCAWYAQQRGVPGDLLSLDTYVAMPLAVVTEGFVGVTGLALLGLGVLPLCGHGTADRAESLRHLAGLAVWICLFLPVCPARDLGVEGLAGFALDGLYFWGKILVLDYVLRLVVTCVPPRVPVIQAGLAGVGTVLLCFG